MKHIHSNLRRALFFLREYFFPAGCAVCGASLVSVNEAWYGLCENCRETADAALADSGFRCSRCGKPLISERETCLACREKGENALDRTLALFPYAGKFRLLLRAYKFGKNRAVGHYFAEKIEEGLGQLTGEAGPPAVSNETADLKTKINNTTPIEIAIPESGTDRELFDFYQQRKEGWKEKIITWALEKLPKSIETPDGEVFFSKNALKNAFGHRIGPLKILSVPYLPEILRNGVMFFAADDGKFTYYNYAHRLLFEKHEHIAVGIIRQDRNGKRFYDNEFFEEIKLTGELGPPAVSTGEPAEELTHPSLLNILRNILFVKKKNAKVKKNAEKNTHGSLESALEWIFSADPVVILSGSEFAKSETDLVTQVAEYFKGIGGMVEREGLGIVDLTRRGVKSSIAHGIGRKKAAAFKAVPEVIKKGKIIDFQLNWKGRGYNTCIIDAPVTIGTTPYIAEVIINQDKDGQRFYVHEVELKEKAQSAFKTGMDTSALRASHLIITRKLADVKKKNAEKTLPFAIVPVPPRPGKIKKAGWDQVEYLACLLERGRGVPVRRCLKRLASKVQKELNREERMRNLRGRMVLKGKPPAVAVILDDVVTTGSTLEACAEVLKEGGTEKVYGISLFYN